MKATFSVLILISIILMGCSSSKTQIQSDGLNSKSISPGEIRAVAQVIQIDTTLSGGPSDPCSKAPCTAWIKLEKIIGYGAGSSTLNTGDTLKTKFAFTLAPANRENFPGLKTSLPGLKVGSSFQADIQLMPSYNALKEKQRLYLIYTYSNVN